MTNQIIEGWCPHLDEGHGPLHTRLTEALARDVETGRLSPGDRLPTHRDLAHRLSIGIGTVTRAYAEAEGLGLIASHVGRGSFVAARPQPAPRSGPIDLARNLAPALPPQTRIKEAMARLSRRPDLIEHLDYAPPAGLDAHRRAGATWINRTTGFPADWTRLFVTAGAQQAISLLLGCLCRPGETLLTEAATYVGVRTSAAQVGLSLRGIAMDQEGLEPEALERAVAETGAKVLYTLPTLQNPTGRVASLARREEIARVARACDLWIIEDDIYAPYTRVPTAPIATFAPDRTFYISGVSKVLGPGLRAGYLLAPTFAWVETLAHAVRATMYSPATFGSLIPTQWIEDGTADELLQDARSEIEARRALAIGILGDLVEPGPGHAPHIWLPMPAFEAERLAGQAQRHGIEVTPPSAPVVDQALISGLRLCLGPSADRETLTQALETIAGAARRPDSMDFNGIV